MSLQAMVSTPLRKRGRPLLCREKSFEKDFDSKRQKVSGQGAEGKAQVVAHAKNAVRVSLEMLDVYGKHGVPSTCQARLNVLMSQWGSARWTQILGLWTFLGDGTAQRPVATPALQVWGPPGTGKTVIVAGFLKTLEIRHVWLNCACFTSIGELHARLAELLRRSAAAVAPEVRELQHPSPVGRQLRSLDRLQAALKLPLDYLSCLDGVGEQVLPRCAQPVKLSDSKGPVKTVIVFDQAQELSRLSPSGLELLVSLPEVLQRGDQISVMTISRLPLSSIGLPISRDPPAVAFRGYTEVEAEKALALSLSESMSDISGNTTKQAVSDVMKFASPLLGYDMRHLKGVGLEVAPSMLVGEGLAAMQQRIEQAVDRRVGLCDLSEFPLPAGCNTADPAHVATLATMHQMTKAEKRLIVAAYLAAHIEKENDSQLFSVGQRKARRPKSALKRTAEDTHITARAPKAALLTRVLAIYHHLAKQPQLVGPPLFEKLASLREAGLIRFMGDRAGVEHDPKVICRAELPLVRECSHELGIDLAEYVMGAQ